MVHKERTNSLIKKKLKISNAAIGIFMIIFLSSGFLVVNDIISSTLTIALWGATFAFLLSKVKCVDKIVLAGMLCLLGTMWLSILVNQENIRNGFFISFSFATGLLLVSAFGFEEFKEHYIKVMLFLSVASLVGFALFSVFPALEDLFVVRNLTGRRYSNLFFYIHPHTFDRNQSIFWEPGAFQTYIGLALLMELLKETVKIKRVLVFAATIITTFSTTGYIALVLIFITVLFRSKKANRKMKMAAGALIAVFVVVLFVYEDVFFGRADAVFGKIINFFSSEEYRNTRRSTSASVRFWGMVKPIEVFLEFPIFGCGYEGLQRRLYIYTRGMNTCTFVNWFAVYGIFYGSIMLVGMIRFAGKMVEKKFEIILVLGVLFVLTMSENYVHNASIMLLALYGYMPEEICVNANSRNQQLQLWQHRKYYAPNR